MYNNFIFIDLVMSLLASVLKKTNLCYKLFIPQDKIFQLFGFFFLDKLNKLSDDKY